MKKELEKATIETEEFDTNEIEPITHCHEECQEERSFCRTSVSDMMDCTCCEHHGQQMVSEMTTSLSAVPGVIVHSLVQHRQG